jgi:hypothetical protein
MADAMDSSGVAIIAQVPGTSQSTERPNRQDEGFNFRNNLPLISEKPAPVDIVAPTRIGPDFEVTSILYEHYSHKYVGNGIKNW